MDYQEVFCVCYVLGIIDLIITLNCCVVLSRLEESLVPSWFTATLVDWTELDRNLFVLLEIHPTQVLRAELLHPGHRTNI